MSEFALGISGKGRAELAAVFGSGSGSSRPPIVTDVLGVDADTAAKSLSRWAAGWLGPPGPSRAVHRGTRRGRQPRRMVRRRLNRGRGGVVPLLLHRLDGGQPLGAHRSGVPHDGPQDDRRVRSSKVSLLDHAYLVAHATETALSWGTKSEWQDGTRLRFADPARTVIDVLDDPRLGWRHPPRS